MAKTYKQLKKRLLRDRKIKKAYNELGAEFSFIGVAIKKRLKGVLI